MRDVRAHYQRTRATVGLGPKAGPFIGAISPLLHLQNGLPELEYPRSDLPPQVHFVALADPPVAAAGLPDWWADVASTHRPSCTSPRARRRRQPGEPRAADDPRARRRGRARGRRDRAHRARPRSGPCRPTSGSRRSCPHSWLLPHTSVMVTNGGFGGVQAALSNGVPLVGRRRHRGQARGGRPGRVGGCRRRPADRVAHAGADPRRRARGPRRKRYATRAAELGHGTRSARQAWTRRR